MLYLKEIIAFLTILVCGYVSIKLGKLFITWACGKISQSVLAPTLRGIWKAIIIIAEVILILKFSLHQSAQIMLTAIGISGVTLGVAAQGFIKDVLGGAYLLAGKNFALGDYITVKGAYSGRVDKISLMSTRLIADDGSYIFLNNSELTIISVRRENV
jgi:small conductance mechanosensitive channel